MKKLYVILMLVLALLVVVGVAVAAADSGVLRTTTLSGAEEVPPADPDGGGFASITLNIEQRTVCWKLKVSNIAPATAAHIHEAPAGENGPVVVPLSPPTRGTSSGC